MPRVAAPDRSVVRVETGLRFIEIFLFVIIYFNRMIVAWNFDGSFSFIFRSYNGST